jgi:predicted transcriptional regulator
MRNEILEKLDRDIEKTSIFFMAGEINIPYTTLYRIHKRQGHTMKNWEKIEDYYSRKKTKAK